MELIQSGSSETTKGGVCREKDKLICLGALIY